jgi:hypothetical protein
LQAVSTHPHSTERNRRGCFPSHNLGWPLRITCLSLRKIAHLVHVLSHHVVEDSSFLSSFRDTDELGAESRRTLIRRNLRCCLIVSTVSKRRVDVREPTVDSTNMFFRNSERTRRNMPSLAGEGGVPVERRSARLAWPIGTRTYGDSDEGTVQRQGLASACLLAVSDDGPYGNHLNRGADVARAVAALVAALSERVVPNQLGKRFGIAPRRLDSSRVEWRGCGW